MKKMKKIIIVLVGGLLAIGCSDLDNMNTDPNSTYTTVPSTLVSYAQKGLSDYVNTPSVNENNFRLTMQYWQETTYVDESNYDFVSRNISNNVWSDNYITVLNNLNQAKKLINSYNPLASEAAAWPTTKKNQLAIIDMQMIYVYQMLVDTFGDIPYSQSLDIVGNQLPVYDKASTIYLQLITTLQTDLSNLDITGDSFSSGDYFYNGNVLKWKKFGNSLLLKLGISIADQNATLAQSTVTSAINGGVFSSSADNCQFNYLSTSPNYNPLYANVIASGRHDYVAGKTIIDKMNSSLDPRISKYFEPVGSVFIGATIGTGASFSSKSNVGLFARTANTPGILLSYTEVAFYLTEVAARWNPTAANGAYNNAIVASMNEWGVSSTLSSAYLTSHPYNPSTWKQSIGNEAWIAMYNQPINSWNFYRRLDYPILIAPPTAISNAGGKVPVRLTYPVKETTTNPTNWAAASVSIGGDNLTTKIFWDVN
jgi:hypothetical protein